MNKLISRNTISHWGPVLAHMGLIFFFSAQPKGSPVLESFPTPPGLGHFIGYAILGLLLYRAFNGGLMNNLNWNRAAALKTLLVGAAYAVSDELHQLFVPGRECSVVDVFIDGAALVTALLVIKLWTLFYPHPNPEARGQRSDARK